VITRKQSLLEQIAVCEGVIERLKAQNPTPAPVLAAVRTVLAGLQSRLASLEAADLAAAEDALGPR
jgi:hypothetical protein